MAKRKYKKVSEVFKKELIVNTTNYLFKLVSKDVDIKKVMAFGERNNEILDVNKFWNKVHSTFGWQTKNGNWSIVV